MTTSMISSNSLHYTFEGSILSAPPKVYGKVCQLFLELTSPSDIAYVLALIKNGESVGSGCEDGGKSSWRWREENASAIHKQ